MNTPKNALAAKAAELKMHTLLMVLEPLNPAQALESMRALIMKTIVSNDGWQELLRQTLAVPDQTLTYNYLHHSGLLEFWILGNDNIPDTTQAEKFDRVCQLFDSLYALRAPRDPAKRNEVMQKVMEYMFRLIYEHVVECDSKPGEAERAQLREQWRVFLTAGSKLPDVCKKCLEACGDRVGRGSAFWLMENMCDPDKEHYGTNEWTGILSIASAFLWRMVAHSRDDGTAERRNHTALLQPLTRLHWPHFNRHHRTVLESLPSHSHVARVCASVVDKICTFAQMMIDLTEALDLKAHLHGTWNFSRIGNQQFGSDPWRFFGFHSLMYDVNSTTLNRIVLWFAAEHVQLPRSLAERGPQIAEASQGISALVEAILAEVGFNDPVELLIVTNHREIHDLAFQLNTKG